MLDFGLCLMAAYQLLLMCHPGRRITTASLSHALTASHLFSSQILGQYILTQNTSLFRPILSNCLCAWLLFSSLSSTYTFFSYDLLANPEKGGGKSLRNTDVFLPYHTTQYHISEGRSLSTVRCHIPKHYITAHKLTSLKAVVFLLSVFISPSTISLLTNSDAATYGF
jgi:hypothetical protein